jgi:hypothetical protein
MTRSRLAVLLLSVLVAACGQAVASPSAGPATTAPAAGTPSTGPASVLPTVAPSPGRDDGWRADIAALVPGMAAIHPALTHSVSRAELDAAATALSSTVATATDDELLVGVLRIVAMVSRAGCDAHTGAYIWGSGTFPVDSMPLRLWLFERDEGDGDEVVIVDARPPYESLIGSRIDSIEGHRIAEVLAAIDPIVPRDNAQTVRLLTPRFVLIPQVLRGLGLAGDGPISLGLTPREGAATTVDVTPIPMGEYNAWAGPYGLHLPADPDVRYLSRIDDALWWEVLDDAETLYVQYNRVDRLPATLVAELQAALGQVEITRIVLDIRHNFGGELSAVNEITPVLVGAAKGEADRLFVLIGRNTFSAGSLLAARLERDAKATLIGEPTGGCPTIWSDPSDLPLPWSGITVSVAGDTAVGVDPNDPRLTVDPAVSAILAVDEWLDGIDPALEQLDVDAP